jgi:hypothetical protein
MVLPPAVYGCETWSLVLKKLKRLSKLENKEQRGTSGPKRKEVTEGRRRFILQGRSNHGMKLTRNFCKTLGAKREKKRPLG